jgi:hypothetical protein
MEATLAEEELGPAEALGEPERTRMAGVNLPLDRYNLRASTTHLCPRGPIATGMGPDWSEEGDVRAGWNGLKAQPYGEPGRYRYGPRAKNVSLGANGTLIPVTG